MKNDGLSVFRHILFAFGILFFSMLLEYVMLKTTWYTEIHYRYEVNFIMAAGFAISDMELCKANKALGKNHPIAKYMIIFWIIISVAYVAASFLMFIVNIYLKHVSQ